MALIAHYKLDETTGTTAVDEIAAVNGAITGGVTLNQAGSPADPAGKSMLFDGVDGVINLGDNLNYDLTDPRSFSFYVNTTNIGASSNMGVMSNTQLSATAQGMGITLFEGKPTFFINTQGDTTRVSVRSNVAIPSGVWSHVVVTKGLTAAASDIKIYIDDVEITSKTIFQDNATGSMSNTNDFTIGNLDGAIYLDALLDDVRIYNTELTAQEVSDIYATGTLQLAGPILETTDETEWEIHAFSLDGTTHLIGQSSTATYSIPVTLDIPYIITGRPKVDHIWEAGLSVAAGERVTSEGTPHIWEAGGAGTTGGAEPTWNLTGTTVDNDITWTYIEELLQPYSQGPIKPQLV